jgi:uncharacterized OsmC-like protein
MAAADIAAAVERVERVLKQRPGFGIQDDAPANARWDGDLRALASHADGTAIATDMPRELGGGGERVTPGWLFRAGLASCVVTSIALNAATRGIELTVLEVTATSRSDARGVLGMADADGRRVSAGPIGVQLRVRIAARGAGAAELRALAADSSRCSPISCVVSDPVPIAVEIQVDAL